MSNGTTERPRRNHEDVLLLRLREGMATLQARCFAWCQWALGDRNAQNKKERGRRFFEEACEYSQCLGLQQDEMIRILLRVMDKPAGDAATEAGDVMTTFFVSCEQQGLEPLLEAIKCLNRVEARPRSFFLERQAIKSQADVGCPNDPRHVDQVRLEETLKVGL